MENLRQRVEALEHHLRSLEAHTQTLERRLGWWRRLAWGLGLLALGGWALHAGPAADAQSTRLDGHLGNVGDLLKTLQALLTHVTLVTDDAGRPEIVITGANLRIVNGLGSTDCTDEAGKPIPDCPNGLGNLIVGYNELRNDPNFPDVRTGSHNVVVGSQHGFSRFGGLVVGTFNTISGDFAVVSGGTFNTASSNYAAVSGGAGNTASGGGSAVSGGNDNTASGTLAAVSGGQGNTASGPLAAVSGGRNRTAAGEADWVAGSLFEDE
jgi:hypothetical protein